MELFKEFTFEAAHQLPNVAPDHKCARLHGHSYRITIHVVGNIDVETGMVVDFADITAAFKPICEQYLDHYFLNDVEGLENPTSENLSRWIWERIRPALPQLSAVQVRETCTSGVIYRGEMES